MPMLLVAIMSDFIALYHGSFRFIGTARYGSSTMSVDSSNAILKATNEARSYFNDIVALALRSPVRSILVVWFECRFLVTEVDGSNHGNSMLFP